MSFLIRLVINAVALIGATYLFKGITVDSYQTALITAFFIGLVNAIIKPVFSFFAFPLYVVTLGLVNFGINGVLILLVAKIVPGFHVAGLLAAILLSIYLSVVSTVSHKALK